VTRYTPTTGYSHLEGFQHATLMLWAKPTSGMARLWLAECANGTADWHMLQHLDREADEILSEFAQMDMAA